MCDMTHLYVYHDSFTCVTWLILIHICDMTHSYAWHALFICVTSFVCVTRLICLCDMTHSYVWHDSFTRVTWLILIHMRDMPYSYVKPHLSRALLRKMTYMPQHTTEWRRCIQRLKLQVTFRKRATNYRALLWKITCVPQHITEWWRPVGSLIFIGHFPQKSPIISGSLAKWDLQLKESYASSPPEGVAKNRWMPYLYRAFSIKEPHI